MTHGNVGGGRVGPYTWEPDSDNSEASIVRREGIDRISRFIGRGVKEHCRAMYRREKEAQAALASDDPTALCRLGWHEHEPISGRRVFFKYMSGRIGVRLNFWIGGEPAEWTATRIAGLGPDATPWRCSVCGSDVPEPVGFTGDRLDREDGPMTPAPAEVPCVGCGSRDTSQNLSGEVD